MIFIGKKFITLLLLAKATLVLRYKTQLHSRYLFKQKENLYNIILIYNTIYRPVSLFIALFKENKNLVRKLQDLATRQHIILYINKVTLFSIYTKPKEIVKGIILCKMFI